MINHKTIISSILPVVFFCFLTFFISLSHAEVTLTMGDGSGLPNSSGNSVEVGLENQNDRVRGVQVDICDGDDYLICTGCETTGRTSNFRCLTNERNNGCCRVVLVADSGYYLIEEGTGLIFILRYDISEGIPLGECRDLSAENVKASDEFEDELTVNISSGKFCFFVCGDIYPDESSPGSNDCGDGEVDIFDVLEAIDIVLGIGVHSDCQLTRADLPTGTPPNCRDPDGIIDIFDILVIIDLVLGREDCCSYYYTGDIKCTTDEDCNDGLYCNGDESCVDGVCQRGTEPCSDDGLYCNGEEGCDEENDLCTHSGNPCVVPYMCDEESDICDDDYPHLKEPDFPTCPDGYYLIDNYEDGLRADIAPKSHTYSFHLDCNADLIIDGFAKEGHPENTNCTLLGGSEPQCNQHQDFESFEVDVDGTTFGNYTDYVGTPDVENAWFNAGPWTTTASDGDHDLTFTHSEDGTTGIQSVHYKVSFCTKCIDCDDANCDDGLYCNGDERCVDGFCQPGTEPCSDDGLYCNGMEGCDEVNGVCTQSGDPCPPNSCNETSNTCGECVTDADCDDDNDCTDDACPAGECIYTNNNDTCDDGLYCNGTDTCSNGSCSNHAGTPCPDDGLYCNGVEECDEETYGCTTKGDPCPDDGLFCNGVENCDEQTDNCAAGANPCPDDGLYCTGIEECDEEADECTSQGNPCNDDNACTDDICNEFTETCTNNCNVQAYGDPCCEDPSGICDSAEICSTARSIIDIGEAWTNCGDEGVKIPICLTNLDAEVGAFQIDLCESIDDCLECVGCEMTERTTIFNCVVNELENGCCAVILFSKNPGGVINPGECNIVVIDYTLKDNPECCNECIEINGENIVVVDQYGYEVGTILDPDTGTGSICPFECGDIEPADDPLNPGWDCGNGIVDIFDILEEVDFVLRVKSPDACQEVRANVPTGTVPFCDPPDGSINVSDLMVITDMALNRSNCCDYYYKGIFY